MLILSFCDNSTVLSVLRIVNIVIRIICIVVPILLTLSVMISIVKEMVGGNNEMIGNILKNSVPKFIAAACIIFVPTFVNLTVSIAGSDSEYAKCLGNGTTENIIVAKNNEARVLVDNALDSFENSEYALALSAVKKLDDSPEKTAMLEELEVVKKVLDIKDMIAKSNGHFTKEMYDAIMAEIDKLEAGDVKDKLLEELEKLKKQLIIEYPVDASDELYKGLKFMSGKSIVDILEENGDSVEKLEERIKTGVEFAGVGTRKASTVAATTLIGTLATYGYKLNYEWWGKYAKLGIDDRWGTVLAAWQYNRDCNDYEKKHDGSDNCRVNMKWYGLDCSGFARWIIINAMQDENAVYSGGSRKSLKAGQAVCEPGDPIYRPGHVAMIVGILEDKNQYVIAESSMGVTLTNVNFSDTSWWCNHITNYVD